MMQEDGEQIGRFKVRGLMRELELVSKQPGSHAYKQATVERPDIPNILNREFDVPAPNQVWCGDITYIWAQGKWHYLAVVMDLYARRVVGWALSNKPDADLAPGVRIVVASPIFPKKAYRGRKETGRAVLFT